MPLRSILTDGVIRMTDNEKRDVPMDFLLHGKRMIDVMLGKAMAYNKQVGLLSIVSTFFVPQSHVVPSRYDARSELDLAWIVNKLNDHLALRVREYNNAYLADVDMIGSTLGKRFFLDDFVNFYSHGTMHHPSSRDTLRIDPQPKLGDIVENRMEELFSAVFRQIESIYRTANQIDQVKLVIFDLDNTMWRGQLVEDYQPGLTWPHPGWGLGLWEAIQHLRWRGIMCAIASKNDRELVVEKWADAVNPFLKFEDFIVAEVNWRPKPENVAAILKTLSLTAKSTVFVDDHPVEREAVKAAFPDIRVIGSNPFLTRRILLWSAETQAGIRSEESKRREEMLSKQIKRDEGRISMSRDEFLAGLETVIEVWNIPDPSDRSFSRLNELVNKTNQFNTTTRRWDATDYTSFWRAGGKVMAFSVKDRFTEYGLVGAIFCRDGEIVQYVMSCRVLGMDIELAVLAVVVEYLRAGGYREVRGTVLPTPVNGPCRDVFERSGFRRCLGNDNQFEISIGDSLARPTHTAIHFSNSAPVSP
jgi:FkbH-like protein